MPFVATARETAELYEAMRIGGGWLVAWKVTLASRASAGATLARRPGAPAFPATGPERDPYYQIYYHRGSIAEAQPSEGIVSWSWRIAEQPDVGRIEPFAVGAGIHVYLGVSQVLRIDRERRRLRVRAHHTDLIGAGSDWAAFARVQVID
jgi:hypothetical protein